MFPSQKQLISDCNSIVKHFRQGQGQGAASVGQGEGEVHSEKVGELDGRIFADLHDLLVFHCLRGHVEYNPVFAKVMSAVVLPSFHAPVHPSSSLSAEISQEDAPVPLSAPPIGDVATNNSIVLDKATASSCFNALASSFCPLLLLEPSASQIAVRKIHSWLRLLVSYHCPNLVQHLDRVLPSWEQPSADLTSSQAEKVAKTIKSGIDLDELEKELGLLDSDNLDNYAASWRGQGAHGGTEGGAIESAPPSAEGVGCIPTHWITAVFTGSLPPVQAASLLDWAILNGERYAGIASKFY